MSIESKKFRKFKVCDLFTVKGSKTTTPDEINQENELQYNYITTQNQNNGVACKSDIFTELGNCITIDSATVGAVFYQESNFIASDHIEVIRNEKLNKYNGLFIVSLLQKEQYRYCYGRKWNQNKIKNTFLYLPIDQYNQPDLEYMEKYIKSLPYSKYI